MLSPSSLFSFFLHRVYTLQPVRTRAVGEAENRSPDNKISFCCLDPDVVNTFPIDRHKKAAETRPIHPYGNAPLWFLDTHCICCMVYQSAGAAGPRSSQRLSSVNPSAAGKTGL